MAKQNIITGLDIGSGSIKVVVASKQKNGDTLDVLTSVEQPSLGVRKGIVINPNEVTILIQDILGKIRESINMEIESVYVSVGGSHVFSTLSHGLVSVSRADQRISQEDIERVLQAAQTINIPSNREILEVFPKEFVVDGEKGIKAPEGLRGVRLEADVLVLGGFSPYIKNLTESVLDAGLQINDLIFSPLASARAILHQKEKELGVAILDIGAGTTGLAVFEEGDLQHLTILPIGSAHITSDIAIYLKSDIDIAERVKLEFGSLFIQGKDRKEKIKLPDGETLTFSVKKISNVIEDRVSEIFGETNKELKKIGRQQNLPSGIVLTGGGCKLPKIRELAKKEFRLPCRIGTIKGFSAPQEDLRFSVACGLVLLGADQEEKKTVFKGGFFSSEQGIGAKIKKIFKVFLP
jgi:cell division protein FtsA